MKTPQIPVPKLAKKLNFNKDLFIKREDLHKYGSHKGRSIPEMIKKYKKEGNKSFVISSSGNAALAAIHYINKYNKNNPTDKIDLKIFVGERIDTNKLKNLEKTIGEDDSIKIIQTERPKQSAFLEEKNGHAKNLRQSTDNDALFGYFELAEELDKIENLKAIFIPTSSGTTAEALGKAFKKLKNKPQIHIVQTEYCHPISEEFDKDFKNSEKISIAGAIVDKIAHRKKEVVNVIKKTEGYGWTLSDEEINEAKNDIKESAGLEISANSALSIAGLKKAIKKGWEFDGNVCCLVTGE